MTKWRPVIGFEGLYEVSSLGEVRSLDRFVNARGGAKAIRRGRILAQMTGRHGYRYITLTDNSRRVTALVHRLVANAFLDGKSQTVNHKNLDKTDNCVDNLEWSTYSENNKHARDNKYWTNGKKLTVWQASEIVKERKSGAKTTDLSKKYGVSVRMIIYISNGKCWANCGAQS